MFHLKAKLWISVVENSNTSILPAKNIVSLVLSPENLGCWVGKKDPEESSKFNKMFSSYKQINQGFLLYVLFSNI